jgi:hypothetical protein
MEVAVALQYPDGRTHNTVIDRATALRRGTEFEMFGHTWRALGPIDTRRSDWLRRVEEPPESARILCVRVT